MAGMTIGRAAAAAGVSVETIRFYERRGLIEQPPRPAGGGFRRYPQETVRRVRFIRQAQGLGFSLREAADLASLEADPTCDAAAVHRRAVAKLEEVDAKIRGLQEVRGALQSLIQACPRRGPLRACSIISALARPAGDGPGADGRDSGARRAACGPQ